MATWRIDRDCGNDDDVNGCSASTMATTNSHRHGRNLSADRDAVYCGRDDMHDGDGANADADDGVHDSVDGCEADDYSTKCCRVTWSSFPFE